MAIVRVGILLCDDLALDQPYWTHRYDDLFVRMLGGPAAGLEFASWRCHAGELPPPGERCDAWVISGSRAGVNDAQPWIRRLEALLRELDRAGDRLLGICFGHQLLHAALGGRVGRSPGGWGLGLYDNRLHQPLPGIAGAGLRLLSIHQDQVLEPAPGTVRVAGGRFCPWYATRRGSNVLTTQGHPEFDREFLRLLFRRVKDRAGEAAVGRAQASLAGEDHGEPFRNLLRRFVEGRLDDDAVGAAQPSAVPLR